MSNEWNGFDDLDLSDNDVDSGERRLRAGRYICEITDAEVTTNKDKKGRSLKVELKDEESGATILDFINVYLPGKEKAQKIGRDRLLSMLTHGGHPTPEKPGPAKTMIGLKVGVNVEAEPYTDNNGKEQMGSAVASWHPYFNPEGAKGLGPAVTAEAPPTKPNGAAGSPQLNDDIPF